MPQNRPELSHEEKAADIRHAAGRLFLDKGYGATTIAQVARDAGVASNVVHWYFGTKDQLFVAVLEDLQDSRLQDLEGRFRRVSEGDELNAFISYLTRQATARQDHFGLIATVHERSHVSEDIATFHQAAHARYETSLRTVLARWRIPEDELQLVTETLVAALESLVMHRASRQSCRRMMTFLAEKLVAPFPLNPT